MRQTSAPCGRPPAWHRSAPVTRSSATSAWNNGMKKSNNRNRQLKGSRKQTKLLAQPPVLQRSTRPPFPLKGEPRRLRRLMRKLFEAVGALATLGSIAALVHDALQQPTIDVLASDQARPFEIPFVVRNESSWFSLGDAWLNCGIDNALTKEGAGIVRLSIADRRAITIAPKGVGNFRCNLMFSPNDLASAHLFLRVTYTILAIFTWHSTVVEFTWDSKASPPIWIKGPIAR